MGNCKQHCRKCLKAISVSSREAPRRGEIWWVKNLDNIKDRPILVVGCQNDTVTFRKCTSQYSDKVERQIIQDYYEAGLEKETYLDNEIRIIPRTSLVRKLGRLSSADRARLGL